MRALDPPNGDVTYTEQLLAYPPEGVSYTPYDQALAEGTLVERLRRRAGESRSAAIRREGLALSREAVINAARRRGLLFREPFRHLWVDRSAFDLVHVHVFSTHLEGGVPFVVSNSIQIDRLYRDAFQMHSARVQTLRARDVWLARATGISHSAYGQAGAARVICFSQYLRKTLIEAGEQHSERLVVVPPFVPVPASTEVARGLHVGFVGDWEAKGGPAVLRAYLALRQEHPKAQLTVVGSDPRLSAAESDDSSITWHPRLPRETLLREIAPQFTVFAYPSRFDGLPLTLLEMMAMGVAPLVSDYGALPEVVAQGEAGVVVPLNDDAATLAGLRALAHDEMREQVSARARARVAEVYSATATAPELGRAYDAAVGS